MSLRGCQPATEAKGVRRADKAPPRGKHPPVTPYSTGCSGHAVLPEPGEHALPTVVCGFLAVARAVIGVEGVRHAFVDVDHRLLVLAEGEEGRAQALDRI